MFSKPVSSEPVSSVQYPVSSKRSLNTGHWILVTFLTAVAVRAALWLLYRPVPYSDTPSYRRLAQAILDGWKAYDGTRTPGYPILLAIVGSDRRVWLVQMAMGLAITLLLFYIGWQISARPWFGGLAALAYTLNLGQLFFEANLLTETLTTFWVMLTLAGTILWLYHPPRRSLLLAFGLGTTSALATITRPLFIYLPFLILLFIVLQVEGSISNAPELLRSTLRQAQGRLFSLQTFKRVTIFLLPVLIIIGGWIWFIHSRFGDWSLTTMTGYHMIQHTGGFFEYVPDEYADLRDTYLRYRDAHIAQYGTQTNTIWEAIPEMQRASGLSFYDLSRTLARISMRLILKHPDLYLRNMVEGWWLFWRAPVYWSAEALRWAWVAAILRPVILFERAILVGCNLLFVVASLWAMILHLAFRLRRTTKKPPHDGKPPSFFSGAWSAVTCPPIFIWCLIGIIWIASILQTILDHGDNPRFLVPLQSLVVVWLMWVIIRIRLPVE